jgi:uncharacterized protein (DUF1501 family)
MLLLYWVAGGWDQTFVFNPKWDSDDIDRDPDSQPESLGALSWASNVTRPGVDRFFEEYGGLVAIVNGLAVGSISHAKCTQLVLTGSRKDGVSDFATRLAMQMAPELPMPAVVLSGPAYAGSDGVAVPLGSTLSGIASGELPAAATYSADHEAALLEWLAAEAKRVDLGELVNCYGVSLGRYEQLTQEIDSVSIADGAGFSEQVQVAAAALGGGLSRVAIIAGTEPYLSMWDTHDSNNRQQDLNFENAFSELRTILQTLELTAAPQGGSLLDHTMVLAMSEMGRTPKLNLGNGKDHWPYTSFMAVGDGVQPGVFGATSSVLAGQPIDLATGQADADGVVLNPEHLIGGLHLAMGLPVPEGTTPFSAAFIEP